MNYGATDVSQCIPCEYNTFSTDPAKLCVPCSADDICYIGTGESPVTPSILAFSQEYIQKNEQPPIYEPPDINYNLFIIFMVEIAVIVMFVIVFAVSSKFRIFTSYYDFYKNLHFEFHANENGEFVQKELINKPSKLGGFCSAITIIVIAFIFFTSFYTYFETNITEEVVLAPIDSLSQKYEFGRISFSINLFFNSYRGDCDVVDYITITTSQTIILKVVTNSFNVPDPICQFTGEFYSEGIITSGEFINFYFNESTSYTSDISISIGTDSAIPSHKSVVFQNITSDQGKVFRGSIPTTFYYSVLPSYYENIDLFNQKSSSKGYRVSSTLNPVAGSQYTTDQIPLTSGLNVKVELFRSDIGITTFKYPLLNLSDFFIKLLSDVPGTIVFIGFIMWIAEFFYYLSKGQSSGRMRLVKKHILEERKKRYIQEEEKLLGSEDKNIDFKGIN